MRRNVIAWGLLYAALYLVGCTAFGIFMAPCTGGCLAITEMAHTGSGPGPAAISFFSTIAVVGFLNGFGAARIHNAKIR
jgi:hypothetical protein